MRLALCLLLLLHLLLYVSRDRLCSFRRARASCAQLLGALSQL